MAEADDVLLYYGWANDELVRNNSFEQGSIPFEDHVKWFTRKLASSDCFLYLFLVDSLPIGQVRIENKSGEFVIGISIDKGSRGKGYGSQMLLLACEDFFLKFPQAVISAYIKADNTASVKTFKKAKFADQKRVIFNGIDSFKLTKSKR